MLGIVVSVIIVTNANLPMEYAWIPFLSSTVLITILILFFDKEEVSLRSLMLAAVASVVGAFGFAATGIVSAAVLSFNGIAALLGLGAGGAGLTAAAGAAAAGAAAAVGATAVVADPPAAAAAVLSPWSGNNNIDWDSDAEGGRRRHRRGGRKFLWRL